MKIGEKVKGRKWEALIVWKAVHIPCVVYINLHTKYCKPAKVLMLHFAGLKNAGDTRSHAHRLFILFVGFFSSLN